MTSFSAVTAVVPQSKSALRKFRTEFRIWVCPPVGGTNECGSAEGAGYAAEASALKISAVIFQASARCWCGRDWFEWLDCESDKCRQPDITKPSKQEPSK